ncbi:MAG: VTT domain-containing protein [Paracoccaceae bacterium]
MADRPTFSEAWVRGLVGDLGVLGPLALIGLMVLAIVVSPIPSGPIAVAAGALYGTLWGGTITVAGALLGALIAFGSARYLGADWVRQSQNPVLCYIARPRSQFALMLIVFTSRLIPFISFDLVSYGAGITCLTIGRFALATAIGVVPICFALAAMGAGMADGDANWMWIVGLGGAITLTPLIGKWIWDKTRTSH